MSALDPLTPFVDDELVTLRAQQRRLLADIPDWVADGLLHGMPTTELPLSTAGGRAELRIRRLAADELRGAHPVIERAGNARGRRGGARRDGAVRPGRRR